MGLWAGIGGSFGEQYGRYEKSAHAEVWLVRKRVRSKYGDNRDVVEPKGAERLKLYIKGIGEQGGLDMYKYALARWQTFQALYSERITDIDRPELIPKSWADPSLHWAAVLES